MITHPCRLSLELKGLKYENKPINLVKQEQNLRVLKKIGDAGKQEWAQFWIIRGFRALEKILAGGLAGKYCVGDEITLADICLVPQYYNAVRYEALSHSRLTVLRPLVIRFNVDLAEFPTITRIQNALSELDAFKKAHPSAQPDAVP
ncbi:Glutathione S-transferase zeta-1 [Phlyctochytrium bullatum]|nr:Glutathione S-transferase zeta-1 [Phlyctochytrium bullatum]